MRDDNSERNIMNITSTIVALSEFFPQYFFAYEKGRKPLKVGIWNDVKAALGDAITAKELTKAIQCYTTNWRYLQACQPGAARIDLDGTADEAAYALHRLELQAAKRKAKQAQRAMPSLRVNEIGAIPAAAIPPRRLSLADLCRAAAERKARAAS
jgi:sRNA-binding protein